MSFSLMMKWGVGGERKPLTAKIIFFLNYLPCTHGFIK